jgi:hypothetical protein
MLKDGDLLVFHAHELGRAFGDVLRPNKRRGGKLFVRLFDDRAVRNSSELLAHRLECAVARKAAEHIRQILARNVLHDFDRRIRRAARRSSDEDIDGLGDLAVASDVFS